jgi:hypothetical protein
MTPKQIDALAMVRAISAAIGGEGVMVYIAGVLR